MTPEAATGAVPRLRAAIPNPKAFLWAGFVVGVAAFLAFGAVRIGAGNWTAWRMSVRLIWTRFTDYLVEQGASAGIVLGVTAAAVASLLGSAVVLWLSFSLKDARNESAPDDISEQ